MAEVKTEQEPSIEEILESIRQIISDDVGGEAPVAAAPAPAKPAPVAPTPTFAPVERKPAPAPAAAPKPLDLTEKIAPPDVTIEMMDSPMTEETNLMSSKTADVAAGSLAKLLAGNVAVEREDTSRPGSVTLEDMARELMKPLIKTWIDQNLPGIIEKAVQKEVEKLSRRVTER